MTYPLLGGFGLLHFFEALQNKNSATQGCQVIATLSGEEGGVEETPHVVGLDFHGQHTTLDQHIDQHWQEVWNIWAKCTNLHQESNTWDTITNYKCTFLCLKLFEILHKSKHFKTLFANISCSTINSIVIHSLHNHSWQYMFLCVFPTLFIIILRSTGFL